MRTRVSRPRPLRFWEQRHPEAARPPWARGLVSGPLATATGAGAGPERGRYAPDPARPHLAHVNSKLGPPSASGICSALDEEGEGLSQRPRNPKELAAPWPLKRRPNLSSKGASSLGCSAPHTLPSPDALGEGGEPSRRGTRLPHRVPSGGEERGRRRQHENAVGPAAGRLHGRTRKSVGATWRRNFKASPLKYVCPAVAVGTDVPDSLIRPQGRLPLPPCAPRRGAAPGWLLTTTLCEGRHGAPTGGWVGGSLAGPPRPGESRLTPGSGVLRPRTMT